ncbi:hypothetical protein [Cupriavidus metallidurans]
MGTPLKWIGGAVVALWLAGQFGIGHFSLIYGPVQKCTPAKVAKVT